MRIKRNSKGKWSVKDSYKYITYKRLVDLRNEDIELLKKYDLRQAKYIYIGQCAESKIDNRHSKIIWDIKNKTTGNKNVHIYEETAITYQSIIRFFKEQKHLNQKEVEDLLFRSEENFIVEYEGLSKEESENKEQKLYHTYLTESKFTNTIVLLKNRDSQLYEINNSIKRKTSKRDCNFNDVQMQVILYNNNKLYIKFTEDEYEVQTLSYTPVINKNDIIEKCKKNTSESAKTEAFK